MKELELVPDAVIVKSDDADQEQSAVQHPDLNIDNSIVQEKLGFDEVM